MKPSAQKILIVGAGPTGLTCAIELARRGIAARLVDRKHAMSTRSRAVGINRRSLLLLEESGVTEKLIAAGIKVPQADIHDGAGKLLGSLRVDLQPTPYNYMLALPQDETERIMHERLQSLGGSVEYDTSVTEITLKDNNGALVTLEKNGQSQREDFDLIIAADGAHSRVREGAGIAFPGYDYDNHWSIADFESRDMPYPHHHAHLFLHDDGRIAVLIAIGTNRYRAVSDTEDALKVIPGAFTVDRLIVANSFVISVRQAVTYQKGCLYLAGDAAHVHSPAGGRGMNLGIEDACDLARRIAEGGLEGYTAARHPVGEKALGLSEMLVRNATRHSPLAVAIRRSVLRVMTAFPLLQKPLASRIGGTD